MTTHAKRALALVGVTIALVLAIASPAFAHATLLTTEPQPQGTYDTSPKAIDLRFNEPVEVSLGDIRLFDGRAQRIVTGAPEHPNGNGNEVRVSIPKLDDGTFVVTWRVISADTHPVEGAFTFQVGATATVKNANGLAARLLSNQKGSTAVGAVYAVDRAAVFGALALLIGSVVFLAAVFPRGRSIRRARVIVWAGWISVAVTTVLGIGLEGLYASALPLTKFFDPSVWSDTLDTRYGRVALLRLALLVDRVPVDPAPVARRGGATAGVVDRARVARGRRALAHARARRARVEWAVGPARDPGRHHPRRRDGVLARRPGRGVRGRDAAQGPRRDARGARPLLRARARVRRRARDHRRRSRATARSAASTRSRTPTTAAS